MHTETSRRLLSLACMLAASSVVLGNTDRPSYPETRTVDVVDEIHGEKIADPYRWLEDGTSDEVQTWIEAQNQLTESLLTRFKEQRAALSKRLEKLYSNHVASPPRIYGNRYFFLKRSGLQNHAVLYVRDGGLDAEPQVVIDPNTFSSDGTVAMDWWHPSPNGELVVYGKSASGSEDSTLYIRKIGTDGDLALQIPHTRHCDVAWDADNGGFLYTRYPAPGDVPEGEERYHRHVYYHKFGTSWEDDPRIWGEGEPKEKAPGVYNASNNQYQFMTTSIDWAKNDLFIRKMGARAFRPVAVGLDGNFDGDVHDGRIYIRTNFEAPRYRVLVTDVSSPAREDWKELIPEQKGVISAMKIVDGKLILNILENAYSRVLIFETSGELLKEVALPTLGSVSGLHGRPDKPDLFFAFESFAYPPVVFRYDMREHKMTAIDRMEVDLPLDQYETKQVWFNSKDGTRVPMFITHKKGLRLDGNNPAVLYGYGGFNISMTPGFYSGAIPWLDAGGIWAVANIRGGGEFGAEWHRAARLEKKQNCFDDFIAAAEKLIADGYTSPKRLGARGGSNGGLLIGAMAVQRPDLFGALISEVPLLDMLRYHLFSMARFWIPEYGSAEDPEQFKFLRAYSPYHNIKPGTEYPAVLFRTAESDTRVDQMHALKMTAAMQAATSSDDPILLSVERKAGHGAGQPLSKYIDRQVELWTFFMWQLDVWGEEETD